MQTTETRAATPPGTRARSEWLLPPTIILLVFAMVVTAVAGFAYVGGQQQSLTALRQQDDALREAAQRA